MRKNKFFIESETLSFPKHGESICGDATKSGKIKAEKRFISIMADGLGSGPKANIMATMTASMALQFTINGEPLNRTINFISKTLPIDQNRKIAYSTFSMIDINYKGKVKIAEYDNPPILIFRNGQLLSLPKEIIKISNHNNKRNKLYLSEHILEKEDRVVMVTDGVTQSGMGTNAMHFGWQIKGLSDFITETIDQDKLISAKDLAQKIIKCSQMNDDNHLRDDASCNVLYCREPRSTIIATGPPFHKENDAILIQMIQEHKGKKVICGGTSSKIIAKGLHLDIEVDLENYTPGLPPKSKIDGFNLVTEGIITLAKVSSLLEQNHINTKETKDPAYEMVEILINSDEIKFISGTRINQAHQDPKLPVELDIRRNVIKKIAHLLESKYLKKTEITYL